MDYTSKKNQRPIFTSGTGNKLTPMPSPNDIRDESINFGGRLEFYNTKYSNRQSSNPFIPALNKIEPSTIESAELIWFKNAVVKVKSVSELNYSISANFFFSSSYSASLTSGLFFW